MSATMTRKLNDNIKFECSDAQKMLYVAAAERDGRTLSSWIRSVLDAASRSGVKRSQHLPEFPKEGE